MSHPESNHAPGPRTWWARPALRTDEDEGRERKVSFLELFFDLIYVVAVAEIAHSLAAHPDPKGVATFVLLFIPVWWLWTGNTFYTERFESGEVSQRVITFLQMVPVMGMAVFAHDGVGATSIGFAWAYAIGRFLLVALWIRGGYYAPAIRPVVRVFAIGFGTGASLWIASTFVPEPLRYVLWVAGLAIEMATPWFTIRHSGDLPKLSTSRLPERFGLFTIIVLGESVVGTVAGLAEQHDIGAAELATGALGLTIAFLLWWFYFDTVGWRETRKGTFSGIMRNFFHLPVVMAFTATGAAVLNVVGHEGEALPADARWLIAGSLAASLISLWAINFVLHLEPHERKEAIRLRWAMGGGGVVLLGLGAVGTSLAPLEFLAASVGVFLAIIVYGTYRWATGRLG